jgi:hypothetical protein
VEAFCRTLQQSATRPGGFNSPVLDWKPVGLAERPAKDFSIKAHGTAGIVSLNFKIGRSVHGVIIRKEPKYFIDRRNGRIEMAESK